MRRDEETRYTFRDGSVAVEEEGKTNEAKRLEPGEHLPVEDLDAGRLEAAVAGYRAMQKANPSDPAVAETRLNQVGYGLLGDKKVAAAIEVFRLNMELHSASANAWDSLAEATEASGDTACAIALYRKALALASRKEATSSQDASVRAHSTQRLQALGVSP